MALTSLHHPIDTPQTLHTIDNWSLHPRKTICTTIRLNNTRKRTFDLRYSKSDVRRRFWNKLIRWGSSVTEWTDEPIAFLDFRLKSFFDCEVKTGVFQLLLMLIILFLWNQTFLFFWFFSFLLLFCCLLFGARRSSSSDTHYVPYIRWLSTIPTYDWFSFCCSSFSFILMQKNFYERRRRIILTRSIIK